MIECRNIAKGKARGELIVSSEPISFLGGVNPENGQIIDPNHELKGEIIKDKVLFIPGGKGSTVGSYVIFRTCRKEKPYAEAVFKFFGKFRRLRSHLKIIDQRPYVYFVVACLCGFYGLYFLLLQKLNKFRI